MYAVINKCEKKATGDKKDVTCKRCMNTKEFKKP